MVFWLKSFYLFQIQKMSSNTPRTLYMFENIQTYINFENYYSLTLNQCEQSKVIINNKNQLKISVKM